MPVSPKKGETRCSILADAHRVSSEGYRIRLPFQVANWSCRKRCARRPNVNAVVGDTLAPINRNTPIAGRISGAFPGVFPFSDISSANCRGRCAGGELAIGFSLVGKGRGVNRLIGIRWNSPGVSRGENREMVGNSSRYSDRSNFPEIRAGNRGTFGRSIRRNRQSNGCGGAE